MMQKRTESPRRPWQQKPQVAFHRAICGGDRLVGDVAPAYNDRMSDRALTLLREALTLSPDERADVAAELLASLDNSATEDPAAVQPAWATEIERRAQRVLSGESAGEPWEDARNRIVQSLKKR